MSLRRRKPTPTPLPEPDPLLPLVKALTDDEPADPTLRTLRLYVLRRVAESDVLQRSVNAHRAESDRARVLGEALDRACEELERDI